MMLFIRYYLVICVTACLCLDTDALSEDGAEILDNLKRYDSTYESGFTVSGTRKNQEELISRQLAIKVDHKWRLSFDGDRCGYHWEILEYEKPKFQQPKGRGGYLNEDGWLVLTTRTKQWGYWGGDCSGNHYEDTVIKISPENEVVEIGKMHNTSLFGPRDAGPNIPKRAVLWSLGRFFSKNIDEITLVKKSANGRVTVSALGKKGDGELGRWELEIEPAAAWMVREASFYSNAKPEVINCEMKNSGTTWSGSYCIPQNAVFNYGGSIKGGRENVYLVELTFNPVIEQFDEKVYEDAKQAVTATKDRPSKLTIHDYRTSPPITFQPDELLDVALDIALDSMLSDDKLVDASKAVAKAENEVTSASQPDVSVTSPSTSPSVQSTPVLPLAQRPWYLLPVKWAVVVLILAVVIAGCAFFLLKFKSQRG